MVAQAILWATVFFAIWAIRRDTTRRDGISAALWIPTLWLGILASRPLSAWLSGQFHNVGYSDVEGSPIDMLFYLASIVAAWLIVLNRKPDWSSFVSKNWPIVLFYLFLLVSVLWADSPLVSFKRWFKEVGNLIIVMVILTENSPWQAFTAVFVRCSYLLIPLSIVFVRYFPLLGRRYRPHSGELEVIGVADQKNSLGAMILVFSLMIIWDLLANKPPAKKGRDRVGFALRVGILILGIYLLNLSDSKTSMVCLALGGSILATTRIPVLKNTVRRLGLWILGLIVLFNASDAFLNLKEGFVKNLGRDMTFTNRTEIWCDITQLNTDPLVGTGYWSFWSDRSYLSKLPDWIPHSAHNGYLEIYIDGGYVGVSLLVILLGVTALRINREMAVGGTYAFVRYASFVVAIVANFFESNFARMTPIGFLFILTAIEGETARSALRTGRSHFFGSAPADRMRESATPEL
jgi:exopolysaccharide production protein ExoQ